MSNENVIQSFKNQYALWLETAAIITAVAILYSRVLNSLVEDWITLPDFSHGFVIPLLSLYVLYDRRKQFTSLKPEGSWWGLVLILFGLIVLNLGTLAMENFTSRLSLLIVMGGTVLFILGREYLKGCMFPIAYLIFMIPLPSILLDKITLPMQTIASNLSGSILQIIGIPVLREGNVLQLANSSLEVAEACSGIRSLISLLALSVVFAYFNQKTVTKRLLLVVSTFPIAIISNTVRVSGTGILANHYGIALAQGFFHTVSGWVLYIIAFFFLMFFGKIIGGDSR
jgi:exosortase A